MLELLVRASQAKAGAAFDTADLLLIRGWSEFHGLRMSIDLAQPIAGIPCDETVALTNEDSSGNWLLWCEQNSIALKLNARLTLRFATVLDALGAIMPAPADALTDIQPSGW